MWERGIELPFKKESTDHLPETAGVYIFKGPDGEYLYVGKAVNLKKRVRSYFTGSKEVLPKVQLLHKKATHIEYILCPSEKDALILEDTIIKRTRPRYNVRLRDDKAYPFIRIGTGTKFPRIHLVRRKKGDGASYFGPYTSADSARKTLRFVANTFALRTCTDAVMKAHKKRPCLRYQLGHCLGPCKGGELVLGQYDEGVKGALEFLSGQHSQLVRRLKAEMQRASQSLAFEKAAKIRDQIAAIEASVEPQEMVLRQEIDVEAIGIASSEQQGISIVNVLKVRKGRVTGKEEFFYETPLATGPGELLRAFLLDRLDSAYSNNILIPQRIEDLKLVESYLRERLGRPVSIRVPSRGDKKRLVELAQRNATHALETKISNMLKWAQVEEGFKARFGKHVDPTWIECVDVSHTFGQQRIGGLVCFREGKPYKSGYRLYNLSAGHQQDDYSGIEEIVRRRIKAIFEGGKAPGIFIVDGGRGQLGVAVKEFSKVENRPLILSIAKGRSGEEEDTIFAPPPLGRVDFKRDDPVYRFIQMVRDEAHRFAITAHRKKRQKGIRASFLCEIHGIGNRRKELLLKQFGGLKGLREASVSDLEKVPGITHGLACKIVEKLKEIES